MYTHLQIRSGYSLMNSTVSIEALVKQAKALNMRALVLTDEHVLYGAIPFYKACQNAGIKPILGMIIHVQNNEQTEPCILLAKNKHGYKQLIQLSTYIQIQERKTIDKEMLKQYTADLIGILPAIHSSLNEQLRLPTWEHAVETIQSWEVLFADGDFYIGVQDHGLHEEKSLNLILKRLQQSSHHQMVAIQDVRYIKAADALSYSCFKAMKKGAKWQPNDMKNAERNKHLRSALEMEQLFSDWPHVLDQTNVIQEKCDVHLDFSDRHLPSYPLPETVDAKTFLRDLCEKQLPLKYRSITNTVRERLERELSVINSMGFNDYFLIVWDFIKYAKENGITVGPGRGSSAGSLVAYLLDITEVDPLKYDLLFERFLNPERVSLPDIDVDFSDLRRDEVIDYVRNKYGEKHVAQIITFGTFAPRSLIRELVKTLGIDQQDARYILQHITSSGGQTITDIVRQNRDLTAYIKQSEPLKVLFNIAVKLEGLPRHISTHAAGVVISDDALTEHVPLTLGPSATYLTQYPMDELQDIGLLKFDFLGLRNLSLLERIITSIKQLTNRSISLNQIPYDDGKTFQLLQKGLTSGIFQLESQGMKRVLSELKPTTFHDIVAVNALYRPGPMDFIPTYIKRKHGLERTAYLHEDLKPILESTYGVLIYQEQIIQIAHRIAGFSLGEADLLRRAVSKKDITIIETEKASFINGCTKQGYSLKMAEELFAWIVRFSNYGFPKSHAVAYSKISYQLAYLKAHYSSVFFAEVLSSVGNQESKVLSYVKEMKQFNIPMLAPSINRSFISYTVENGQIRMGLTAIKGVGAQTVKEIIAVRKGKPFQGLYDFCLRIPNHLLKRSLLEVLIMAGAFDELHENRASLLATLDQAMEQGELFKEFVDQPNLFPEQLKTEEKYVEVNDFSPFKKLADEKELLGIYVSEHPFKRYRHQFSQEGYIVLQQASQYMNQRHVKGIVIIESIRKIRTRRGDPMAFITISDETDEMEAVVFPNVYRQISRWLREEIVIAITGKIDMRHNQYQWIIDSAQPVDLENIRSSARLFIKWSKGIGNEGAQMIRDIAKKYPGDTTVIIFHEEEGKTYQLKHVSLHPTESCVNELKLFFGSEAVVLTS
ncbi:MAG TPA: DNA polymerase III subunit alpha [Cerasibacillus sp.]|uniref:DNA polymerase III subunit alpha n=1 Tax=Cerasibacillus sp. TaxID=2498711 RepID=UPI002F42B1BB